MRILQVLPSLNRGGAEQVVVLHSKALLDRSHEVTIVTEATDSDGSVFDLPTGVKRLSVSSGLSRSRIYSFVILFWWIFGNRKKLLSFDVVHAHLTYGAIFVFFLRLNFFFCSFRRPKIVFTHHSSGMDAPFLSNVIQFSAKFFVDDFIFVSREKHFLSRIFFPLLDSRKVILNGIEFPCNLDRSGFECRQKGIFNGEVITIGALSRLTPDRNPHQYLDLFERLVDFENDLKFDFVLGGYGSLLEEVKTQIKNSFKLDRVALPGLILEREKFFRRIDIYITLVANDYPGISGLEAISFGVPTFGILINDHGFQTGSCPVPSFSNLCQLAQHIIDFCKSSNHDLSFTRRQLDWAKRNYSIDKMCEDYLACYKN